MDLELTLEEGALLQEAVRSRILALDAARVKSEDMSDRNSSLGRLTGIEHRLDDLLRPPETTEATDALH